MTLRALGRPVTTASTLLLLAALLAAVSACGRRQAAETAPAGDAPAAVPVEMLTLAPDVFQRVVTLSGSTEALRDVLWAVGRVDLVRFDTRDGVDVVASLGDETPYDGRPDDAGAAGN